MHIKPGRIEESEAVDIMCVKGSLNTHNATSQAGIYMVQRA